MEWVSAHVETIGAVMGVLSGGWAFLVRAEKTFRDHLKTEFATKDDLNVGLQKIETKLDKALLIAFQTKEYNREDKLKLL